MLQKTFLAILLITSIQLYSQNEIGSRLAENLELYRAQLIQNDTTLYQHLGQLVNTFRAAGFSEEEVNYYLYQVSYPVQHQLMSFRKIRKFAPKYFPPLDFVSKFSDYQFNIIKQATPLLDLIHFELLENDYPFALLPDSLLAREISFYKIIPGEKVGEIGAGEGVFSLAIAMVYPDIQLYINEVSLQKVDYISDKIAGCSLIQPSGHIHVVRGKKKSTGLDGLQLDKIIIRNTFHHFDRPQYMLQSIQSSLHPDGRVFLLENTTDDDGHAPALECDERLNESEIISFFNENGFQLLRKQEHLGQLLLEFSLQYGD